MDFVTVAIIVLMGWVGLVAVVVAMCKAAARGDSAVRQPARPSSRAWAYTPEGNRPFERPALG